MKKYEAAAAEIEKMITGMGGKGKLPTEEALGKRLRVSRQTVRNALSLLEARGLIRTVQGSGIYLTGLLPDTDSGHIALLVPSRSFGPFPSLIRDMTAVFSSHGFRTEVLASGGDLMQEEALLQEVSSRAPAALFMVPDSLHFTLAGDLLLKLQEQGCPVFFLFSGCRDLPQIPVIGGNPEEAGFLLAGKLAGCGCRNILGIFRPSGEAALAGFLLALHRAGLPCGRDRYLILPEGRVRDADLLQLLRTSVLPGLSSLDAVLCGSSLVAGMLLEICAREGIRIPQDLAAAAIGEQYFHSAEGYSLTRLRLQRGSVGQACWEAFQQKTAGKHALLHTSLPWEFVPGNTCLFR